MKFRIEPWILAEDQTAHAERRCGGVETCTACRTLAALYRTQIEAVHSANLVARQLWADDSATLDAYLGANGAPPKSAAEWPFKPNSNDLYHQVTAVFPNLGTTNIPQLIQLVTTRYKKLRWPALIQCTDSPPHYKKTMPIPIHNQVVKISRIADREYHIRVLLRSSREGGPTSYILPVRVRDGYQGKILHNLEQRKWKLGAASIAQDRKRPSIWYLTLTYKRLVAEVPVTERTVAINRGMRNFLVATSWDGRVLEIQGSEIIEHVRRIAARRRQIQRAITGSGRRGRGRERALAPLTKLREAGERWRYSKCQLFASELVKFVEKADASVVYISDFTGIRDFAVERLGEHVGQMVQEWPYYQLQTQIVSLIEAKGRHVVQLPAHNISTECPACGHVDDKSRKLDEWVFNCTACDYKRHLDVAATENLRKRGDAGAGIVLVGSDALKKSRLSPEMSARKRQTRMLKP